jgi:hypothetical protein
MTKIRLLAAAIPIKIVALMVVRVTVLAHSILKMCIIALTATHIDLVMNVKPIATTKATKPNLNTAS